MSDNNTTEKIIDEVENILFICHLNPDITLRTMAKMIIAHLCPGKTNNLKQTKNEK